RLVDCIGHPVQAQHVRLVEQTLEPQAVKLSGRTELGEVPLDFLLVQRLDLGRPWRQADAATPWILRPSHYREREIAPTRSQRRGAFGNVHTELDLAPRAGLGLLQAERPGRAVEDEAGARATRGIDHPFG